MSGDKQTQLESLRVRLDALRRLRSYILIKRDRIQLESLAKDRANLAEGEQYSATQAQLDRLESIAQRFFQQCSALRHQIQEAEHELITRELDDA